MRSSDQPARPLFVTVRVLAILVSALAFQSIGLCLDPDRALVQYIHTSWGVDAGLQSVRKIRQTPDGYLWLGTRGGLVRFDGIRFKVFGVGTDDGLESSTMQDLLVDSDGSLWMATLGGGIAHFKDGRFRSYTSRNGLPSDDIMSMYRARDGVLWAGTRSGKVARLKQDVFETVSLEIPAVPITAFAEKDSALWITTFGAGVYRLRGSNLSNLSTKQALPDPRVAGLCFDSSGALWFAGRRGLSSWNGISFVPHPVVARAVDYAIGCIEDRDKNLWIATSTGLFRFTNGRIEKLDRDFGLSASFASEVFEDREGNVWVGTRGGIDRLRDAPVRAFSERDGLISSPGPLLAREDGAVWTASSSGVARIAAGAISTWHTKTTAPIPYTLLSLPGDSIFLGTERGGFRWRPSGITPIPELRSMDIRSAWRARDGTIWLGTANGLLHWNPPNAPQRILADVSIAAVTEDGDGTIWAGSNLGGGLYRTDGKTVERFGPEQGLRSPNVYTVFADSEGRIWIGSMGGLSWFHQGKLVTVSSRNGLPSDQVVTLTEDRFGRLWFSGYGGLASIERQSLDAFAEGKQSRLNPTIYSKADGFNFVNSVVSAFPAGVRGADGQLWFSGAAGVAQVTPPPPGQARNRDFTVFVEQVRIDGEHEQASGDLRLPPGARSLEFEYTAIALSTPEAIRFRYQLEGVDLDWVDAGTRRVAYYHNLRPGHFRFRVQASASEGHWQEASAIVVQQLPFFYQTPWFVALMLAAGGSLTWTVHRFRVQNALQQMLARSEERTQERIRIAQELHDTVVQAIAGSTMLVENASEKVPDTLPVVKGILLRALDQLDSALSQSRTALAGLRDSVGEADDLPRALAALKSKANDAAEFRVVTTGESGAIHPVIRYEVYRIASEAILNAFQHSDATSFVVDLSFVDDLRLTVRDNGRGIEGEFLNQGRNGHFGLQGMKERAEQMGASLEISSRAGYGTEVTLTVPERIAFPDRSSARPFTALWRRTAGIRSRRLP